MMKYKTLKSNNETTLNKNKKQLKKEGYKITGNTFKDSNFYTVITGYKKGIK